VIVGVGVGVACPDGVMRVVRAMEYRSSVPESYSSYTQ